MEPKTIILKRKFCPKTDPDILIDASISFFFQIDELKKFLFPNKNIDLINFKNLILTKVDPKIKTFQTYDKIFEEILTRLDPDNQINKDYYNPAEKYDEYKGLKKFIEKLKNKNIIQKLFLIPKEEKKFCKKCGMNTYQFYFGKYIMIKNPINELLFQKIFQFESEEKRDKSCDFCNGQTTDCAIERKTLDFPEILIVLISPLQINNFLIETNLIFTNGIISYSLSKFIEYTNNCLYWINDKNTMICHKYEITSFGGPEKIADKKPIVLFYNLVMNAINNQNGNVKTIDVFNIGQIQNPQGVANQYIIPQNTNQTNIQPNMNKVNIPQNTNLINIQPNMNKANIAQNMNQKNILPNMNPANAQPNINPTKIQPNPQVMNNQQIMGQQNINPQFMNQQNNFPNMNQQMMNQQFNQKPQNNQQNIINFNNNQGFIMNPQNGMQNNSQNNINNNNFGNNMNQFNNMDNNNMPINNWNMNNMNNGFMMNNFIIND